MKSIILYILFICCLIGFIITIVPKSVFFKNERTPNDYYDVVFRNQQNWQNYSRYMRVHSVVTEEEKRFVQIYLIDQDFIDNLPKMTGGWFIPQVEVWDGKKWLHKGKWQEDFFRIAEGLKAEQEARDKAEKEAERKILEAYK